MIEIDLTAQLAQPLYGPNVKAEPNTQKTSCHNCGSPSADHLCKLCKRGRLRLDPAYSTPELTEAQAQLAGELKKVFRRQRDRAKDKAGRLLKTHLEVRKAWLAAGVIKADDPDDGKDIADEIYDALHELFGDVAVTGTEPLQRAAMAGTDKGVKELEITDDSMISPINAGALKWASDRAAEMVGMRRQDDGALTANPDAKWAITDTTRADLRRIVTNGFAKETPLDDLIDEIQDAGAFSDARAEMIARTEVQFAQVHSNYDVWQDSGLVKTIGWQLSIDHVPGCDCDNNEGEVVPIGEEFPSGDEMPPVHPNCWCTVVAVDIAG